MAGWFITSDPDADASPNAKPPGQKAKAKVAITALTKTTEVMIAGISCRLIAYLLNSLRWRFVPSVGTSVLIGCKDAKGDSGLK